MVFDYSDDVRQDAISENSCGLPELFLVMRGRERARMLSHSRGAGILVMRSAFVVAYVM